MSWISSSCFSSYNTCWPSWVSPSAMMRKQTPESWQSRLTATRRMASALSHSLQQQIARENAWSCRHSGRNCPFSGSWMCRAGYNSTTWLERYTSSTIWCQDFPQRLSGWCWELTGLQKIEKPAVLFPACLSSALMAIRWTGSGNRSDKSDRSDRGIPYQKSWTTIEPARQRVTSSQLWSILQKCTHLNFQ